MPTSHLIAFLELSLGCDEDLDGMLYSWLELILVILPEALDIDYGTLCAVWDLER